MKVPCPVPRVPCCADPAAMACPVPESRLRCVEERACRAARPDFRDPGPAPVEENPSGLAQLGRGLLGVALLASTLFVTGCLGPGLGLFADPPLEEQTLYRRGFPSDGKILVLDISGKISIGARGLLGDPVSPDAVARVLRKAGDDKAVKALVLRIDTPGGGATASNIIFKEVLTFKQKTGIPVYASILSLGCSGGYYISVAADKIYAHPTSVVGSIGVIGRVPQARKLAGKIGYDEIIIKSGPMKDMGNPLRDLSDKERAVFQGVINDMYARFLAAVVENRPAFKTAAQLKPIADGRVYTAAQAKANGLIDDIKYLQDVLDEAAINAGLRKPKVVRYLRGPDPDTSIYTHPPGTIKVDFGTILPPTRPGFYYLWLPAR